MSNKGRIVKVDTRVQIVEQYVQATESYLLGYVR